MGRGGGPEPLELPLCALFGALMRRLDNLESNSFPLFGSEHPDE